MGAEKPGADSLQGLFLVGAGNVAFLSPPQSLVGAFDQLPPISHRPVVQIVLGDDPGGGLAELLAGIGGIVAGGHENTLSPAVRHRVRQEFVDRSGADRPCPVELALHRRQPALFQLTHQVDADVASRRLRPVRPQPQVAETTLILRIRQQGVSDQFLKSPTAVVLPGVIGPQTIERLGQMGHRFSVSVGQAVTSSRLQSSPAPVTLSMPQSSQPALVDLPSEQTDGDNITDWCLDRFRTHYRDDTITKDDIWEYLYGVMHAPDWRERYKFDLQRNLPRVPFASDFETFRRAGRHLMELHINYETVPEWPVECLVDGRPDNGGADPDAYRITGKKMRWGKGKTAKARDRSVLVVNDRCRLVGIPEEAHRYTVSGRTPLEWAMESLRHKLDKPSGITDDPNGWHAWAEEPFNLIRHLRRLVHLSVETARTVKALPPSLDGPTISGAADHPG